MNTVEDEGALLQAARARLPETEERHLRRLIAKSERGTLTPKELAEYRALVLRAEQLNVTRAEALAKLVRQHST